MKTIKKLLIIIALVIFGNHANTQNNKNPKLVVGIVIDQMRYEYLYRFQDNYTENGFKRLLKDGFNVKNTHYNYIPTSTGPGHASIYTGTTPANHGVVSNDWYRRSIGRVIYCAEDTIVNLVDNSGIIKGGKDKSFSRSPKNLRSTTITDELKLFTNGRSKVLGVSLKDRGAIFPAGHLANGAYWYNPNTGDFISSSYYGSELPKWLKHFNRKKIADSLLNGVWETTLPIQKYSNSKADNAPFEKIFNGKKTSEFPYDLKKLREKNNNFGFITEIPQGNSLLTKLAKAAISEEKLGQRDVIDFLTISYSSTDYVGHHFGIRSKELEDTYVKMDNEIEVLLTFLDKVVGKDNYTLFLTADHAASDNPIFLNESKLPGEFYYPQKIKQDLNTNLSSIYGADTYITFMDKTQLYFSDSKIQKENLIEESMKFLKEVSCIKELYAPEFSKSKVGGTTIENFVKNAYNSEESGDIIYHVKPGWMEYRKYGTSHSNAYNNDTHVPMIWYGCNIPKGETVIKTRITQIVPTLSMLLNIPLPNASDTMPIEALFETIKEE